MYHYIHLNSLRGRHGRDRMVVGLTLPMQSVPITTIICEFEPLSWRGGEVQDTTL